MSMEDYLKLDIPMINNAIKAAEFPEHVNKDIFKPVGLKLGDVY